MYVTLQRIARWHKTIKSVYKFKLKVKSFLLQNCFYTIRDYTDREKEK